MTKPMQFEKTITELETIISRLEKGDLPLEESLKQFEKGISLAHKSQEILRKAEQKIETLTSSNDKDCNHHNE